jgi:hypothetical protein
MPLVQKQVLASNYNYLHKFKHIDRNTMFMDSETSSFNIMDPPLPPGKDESGKQKSTNDSLLGKRAVILIAFHLLI